MRTGNQGIRERQLEIFSDTAWPTGVAGVFAAEGHAVRILREQLKNERSMDRRAMYLGSYWIIGLAGDERQIRQRTENAALSR